MTMTEAEKMRIIAKLGGKKYLALSAFARFAGMAYTTAKKLSSAGKLKTISVGGITRVPTDEVLRFMTEGNAVERPSSSFLDTQF